MAVHQASPPWDSLGKNTGMGEKTPNLILKAVGSCVCVLSSFIGLLLLLLLLSHFSRVRLCDAIDGSHQAPPSLGFSRQEHWSGLPFPSPMQESESEVSQSCPTLHDPMDCSLPGSSIHGIFQARVLEWATVCLFKVSGVSGSPDNPDMCSCLHSQL